MFIFDNMGLKSKIVKTLSTIIFTGLFSLFALANNYDFTECLNRSNYVYSSNYETKINVNASFDEDTFYLVSSVRGDDPLTAGVFEENSDNTFTLKDQHFEENEEFKIKLGSTKYIETAKYINNSSKDNFILNDYIKVTSVGSDWTYDFTISTDAVKNVNSVTIDYFLNAEYFGKRILEETDAICAAGKGHNKDLLMEPWNKLENEYSNYPELEKTRFVALKANEKSETLAEKGAYRYDYIISLYGGNTSNYLKNFANRNVTPINPKNNVISNIAQDSSLLISVVLIVSFFSVTLIASIVIASRNKKQ